MMLVKVMQLANHNVTSPSVNLKRNEDKVGFVLQFQLGTDNYFKINSNA